MPAWFDLAQLDQLLKGEQDGPGVAASIAHIGEDSTFLPCHHYRSNVVF